MRRVRLAALFRQRVALGTPFALSADTVLYIATLTAGYICLLMAGLWMSRLLKTDLLEDVFNVENESFMQETELKGERVFRQPPHPLLVPGQGV